MTTHPSAVLRDRLADARLYLCTDARRRSGDLRTFVRAAFAGGVDIVQLRDKDLQVKDELAALAVLAQEAAAAGALVAANDRADVAALAGVDVLHVGQDDLAPGAARRIAGGAALGASTHDRAQLAAADADPDVDYLCVGPVWATPTKPGRPAAGLDLVAAAARSATKPWFAIGGIDTDTIDDVVAAGARRVVVVRALTEAQDPQEVARRLRARLVD